MHTNSTGKHIDIDIEHKFTTAIARGHETLRQVAKNFREQPELDSIGAEERTYMRSEREWEHYLRPEYETNGEQ